MGNTCTPMVDSCQCMAKPIQYCKVIRLQLKKKKHLSKPPQASAFAVPFARRVLHLKSLLPLCIFSNVFLEMPPLNTVYFIPSSPYFLISSHSLSLTFFYIYIYIFFFLNSSCHLTFIWDYIQIGRILVGNR